MSFVAQRFEPTADSVGAARRFAVSAVRAAGADPVEDDVRTVVSELATNAVLHARTPFTVSVTTEGSRVRVAVTDGAATRPRPSRYGGTDASTGRGLHIVAALGVAWGVDGAGDGKSTWCDLDVTSPGGRLDDEAEEAEGPHDVDALLARFGGDEVQARAA